MDLLKVFSKSSKSSSLNESCVSDLLTRCSLTSSESKPHCTRSTSSRTSVFRLSLSLTISFVWSLVNSAKASVRVTLRYSTSSGIRLYTKNWAKGAKKK